MNHWSPEACFRFRGLRLRVPRSTSSFRVSELPPGEVADLGCGAGVAESESALGAAHPAEEDGAVLFPFRRVFLMLTRPGLGGGAAPVPGGDSP
jgi:trans-aconitate methyltransferase